MIYYVNINGNYAYLHTTLRGLTHKDICDLSMIKANISEWEICGTIGGAKYYFKDLDSFYKQYAPTDN